MGYYGATTGPASTHKVRARAVGGSGVTYITAGPLAFVSSSGNAVGSGTNPIPAPATIAAGNLLVAFVGIPGNVATPNFAGPSGWSQVGSSYTGGPCSCGVFTKIATASEPGSYSFTTSSTSLGGVILQFSGGAGSLDGSPGYTSNASNATSPHNAPSQTPTGATDYLVVCYQLTGDFLVNTPAGMSIATRARDIGVFSLSSFYQALTGTSPTGTITTSTTVGTNSTGMSLLVKSSP